jgi:hypothetical protein
MGALPPQLPFGTDRADGGTYGGTATPDGSRQVQPSELIFEETSDSPIFDLGEQATCVKKFKIDPEQTLIVLADYGRGQIFTDSGGRQWRILNIAVNYQAGDFNIVAITSEGINIYVPQAEYNVEEYQINPALQKHPRYAPLNQTFGSIQNNAFVAGTFSPIAEVELAVQQLSSGQGSQSSSALTDLQAISNFITASYATGDLVAQQAALELLKKRRRGEDSFYLAGYKVTYSTFFPIQTEAGNNAPDLDMGGRIEDPTNNQSQVILPPEFWMDINGNNIFTLLAQTLSPQFYGNGISWLRQADSLVYQRTWMQRVSTWLMGPAGGQIQLTSNDQSQSGIYFWVGNWDIQIYTPLNSTDPNYPKYDF